MPSKKPKLGQNFLIDEAACLRIADALGDTRERTVVEIGPGHGAITDILAQRCRHLHCIEFDPALARELSFRFRNDAHVTIHHADILKTDLAALKPPGQETLDVIGNLPYYITSDILLHLFAAARAGTLHRAVLMMQREVADRVTAHPGTRDYGALSAATQMHASATTLFTLPPSAFSPPPEVYSSVVRLDFAPRFDELRVDPAGFNSFLRAGFAQKRKTLQNNLRTAGFQPAQIHTAWPASLPQQIRAEAVSLDDMASLYRALTSASRTGTAKPAS
ncbi:MAG TPA: 16S rRNA (adenine(1518)-N(6)/adenine(1519)-N(6))-dimethyltransferase RsmA [Acidobacteriaceae bacterium]|jgi:16S rRNA (adenine1518-N6/adenine1519-N6)-dimethyltransferase|nr:16S rRNA (adenine(1518)-N(6)/adenine(1519)-N(6))-dimethyltransferase RsmA [Acidobacteriaceae bacterium]